MPTADGSLWKKRSDASRNAWPACRWIFRHARNLTAKQPIADGSLWKKRSDASRNAWPACRWIFRHARNLPPGCGSLTAHFGRSVPMLPATPGPLVGGFLDMPETYRQAADRWRPTLEEAFRCFPQRLARLSVDF